MNNLKYRAEIDGLRALAVLSVIIFHAGVDTLSGGFVGVDIFYVISGYLITTIISTSLQKQEFSFTAFYIRRIKRLLPAALIMVFTTVALGIVFLTPDKYIELSKSAIYANLFMANVWFSNNSGYFDLSTQISPLVHMWSLSVEEQFYFVFPFILFISYKIKGMLGVKLSIFVIFVFSFVLSVVLTDKYPNFSFYMLHTRAWELCVGAGIALLPALKSDHKLVARFLSFSGLIFIGLSLFVLTENDIYPGYLALFPVFGTALILFSLANNNSAVKSLLTFPLITFVGKISYSAYLWHWPIVVYYRIHINQRHFNSLEILLLIVASLITGYLSWKYIEEKFRYQKQNNKKITLVTSCALALSLSLPFTIYFLKGIPSRISQAELAITDSNLMWNWSCTEKVKLFAELPDKFCVIGQPWEDSAEKGIIWGDSHSMHYSQLLHHEALANNLSLIIAPLKCPPYLNRLYVSENYLKFPNFTQECTLRNKLALNWLKENEDVNLVILAAAWSGHVRQLYTEKMIENKNQTGNAKIGAVLSAKAFNQFLPNLTEKEILILGDVPRPNKMLNDCAAAEMTNLFKAQCMPSDYKYLPSPKTIKWHKPSDEVLVLMENIYANVNTIIPSNTLCDDVVCSTYINNELIYKDGNHIRRNLNFQTVNILSKRIGLQQYFSERIKSNVD